MSHRIGCVKATTDILGDKWTPPLLRCLNNYETLRFCQLQELVGGINPRTLSARLNFLEQHDIIEKCLCTDSSRYCYRLTQKGNDLMPVLFRMEQWSKKYYCAPGDKT